MHTFSATHSNIALDDTLGALETADFAFGDRHRVGRIVLDTFDGRLHSSGLRLELRDGPRRELVLIGRAGSPPVHLAWSSEPPSVADDLPAGPFGSRIASVIDERALVPVLDLSSVRREAVRHDRRGRPVVTVVLHDDVNVASASAEPLYVIEVRASVGSETEGRRAIEPLRTLGLTPGHGDLVDAVLALTGESLGGNRRSPGVPLHRGDDAFESFRKVLRNLLEAALENLPGTIAALDPEFLHDLRVALRRTRSVLSESKGVLPNDVRERYRVSLADLSAATGHARDLDVYVLTWPDTIAAVGLDDPSIVAPLHDELIARRATAHAQLRKVLRSKATARLLESWRVWLEDTDASAPYDGPRPIGTHIASRISKAQTRLLRDGRAITPDCPAERLHDLRKDAKKLRYLFECFGSVLPAKGRKAFVAQLRGLQDNLGQHQDAEIQVAELRALAHDLHERRALGADVLLVVGRIIEHLEQTRQHERVAFAAHFAAYDSAENRATLDGLLAKAAQR